MDRATLDTTEVYSDGVWRTVHAKLNGGTPVAIAFARLITFNNRVLLFGITDILFFDLSFLYEYF